MNHISKKADPKNIITIPEVGAFDLDAIQGMKKKDISEHFDYLQPEHHEILWKAVSKGEMPENSIETN